MAPREELVESAVSFLQDPSVAAAPIEKRRAFLENKNLTPEEIDLSFARAGTSPPSSSSAPAQSPGYAPQYRQAPYYNYSYPPYPGGPWPQQAMEPPRRDWRDWFIMATVTSGIGYGLYQIGKRYVMPLIKPPTPEQLEQDKSDISTQFDRAFALIDQLANDTQELKNAESERNEKLDSALRDLESVIGELKMGNERREQDSRRVVDDVNGLKDAIPKALEGWKADKDAKVAELGSELKSLKTLLSHRLQAPGSMSPGRSSSAQQQNGQGYGGSTTIGGNGDGPESGTATPLPSSAATTENGIGSATATGQGVPAPSKRPNRAAIPAWQMAASQKQGQSQSGVGSGSEGNAQA